MGALNPPASRGLYSPSGRARPGAGRTLGAFGRFRGRFTVRLVAGLLVVAVPLMALLAILLTRSASSSLESDSGLFEQTAAADTALRVGDWIHDRQVDIEAIALVGGAQVGDAELQPQLTALAPLYDDFDALAVFDTGGRARATAPVPSILAVTGKEDWFQKALVGPVITDITRTGATLSWIVAGPVKDASGRVVGVTVGDLHEAALSTLVSHRAGGTGDIRVFNGEHLLVFNSAFSGGQDDASLLGAGGYLGNRFEDPIVDRGVAGDTGSARVGNLMGQDVIAGYAPMKTLNWVVVASRDAGTVLAPVAAQTRLAIVLTVVGALLLGGVTVLCARLTTRPVRRLSVEVSESAATCSAASEELAATTAEQTAAATQTSASMEELSRGSSSVAETVERVADQAEETRRSLDDAQEDIRLSGERTVSLAARVHEVTGILTLINDIADQTNLLALNAAIEAARAGDAGRGFAVVADEVRRLAERSKASAADIRRIIDGAQSETNTTVMAMETGAKKLVAGLALMEEVADSCARVRLTSQQQRLATEQVMQAMEQITTASAQVSATAQQIAESANTQASLASDLDASVTGHRRR